MKFKDLIIHNSKEFKEIQKNFAQVFNISQVFPYQVFNDNFGKFSCYEFDRALFSDFWPALQKLAQASHDNFIFMAMISPDPVTYMYKNFGYYNWFKLPLTITAKEYGEVVHAGPSQDPLENIVYISEIVAWVPLSCKWAIWGQRSDGICILGFADENSVIPNTFLPGLWRPIDEALEGLVSLTFPNQQIPQDVADTFIENYSNK
jgi:hypothetical protein